jgi:hypothetical protein
MPLTTDNPLTLEWTTLQNNFEQYERSALWVKLVTVALFVVGLLYGMPTEAAIVLMLVLWLQEAITRTSQARLGTRLLHIELMLRRGDDDNGSACQLHTDFETSRGGAGSLVSEYFHNALRPTVAFPYVVLVVAQLVLGAG